MFEWDNANSVLPPPFWSKQRHHHPPRKQLINRSSIPNMCHHRNNHQDKSDLLFRFSFFDVLRHLQIVIHRYPELPPKPRWSPFMRCFSIFVVACSFRSDRRGTMVAVQARTQTDHQTIVASWSFASSCTPTQYHCFLCETTCTDRGGTRSFTSREDRSESVWTNDLARAGAVISTSDVSTRTELPSNEPNTANSSVQQWSRLANLIECEDRHWTAENETLSWYFTFSLEEAKKTFFITDRFDFHSLLLLNFFLNKLEIISNIDCEERLINRSFRRYGHPIDAFLLTLNTREEQSNRNVIICVRHQSKCMLTQPVTTILIPDNRPCTPFVCLSVLFLRRNTILHHPEITRLLFCPYMQKMKEWSYNHCWSSQRRSAYVPGVYLAEIGGIRDRKIVVPRISGA